jgi:hypothetical protein
MHEKAKLNLWEAEISEERIRNVRFTPIGRHEEDMLSVDINVC